MATYSPIANALSNALFLVQALAGDGGIAGTPGTPTTQAPAPAQVPQTNTTTPQTSAPQTAPTIAALGVPRPAPQPQVVDPYQQTGAAAAGAPAPAAINAATAAARAAEAANPAQVNDPTTTMARQAAEGNAAAARAQQPTALGGGQGTGFSAAASTTIPATDTTTPSPTQPTMSSPVGTPTTNTTSSQASSSQGEPGWFDTLLNNLSGQNLKTSEDLQRWRQLQTLGVVGNKLGAALGAGHPIVESFGNTMGDIFAGNLASKNAELRETSQQDVLNKILSAMGGVKTPSGAAPTVSTGAASAKPGTTSSGQPLSGVSALASSSTGFTPPSGNKGTSSMDDLIDGIRNMTI